MTEYLFHTCCSALDGGIGLIWLKTMPLHCPRSVLTVDSSKPFVADEDEISAANILRPVPSLFPSPGLILAPKAPVDELLRLPFEEQVGRRIRARGGHGG